jgi:hypothetical protein
MTLERFSNSRGVTKVVQGDLYFHPTDEDLSARTPERKSHLSAEVSLYTNWRTAIVVP